MCRNKTIHYRLESEIPASEKQKDFINYFNRIGSPSWHSLQRPCQNLPPSLSLQFLLNSSIQIQAFFSHCFCIIMLKKTLRKGFDFSTLRKVAIQL